MGPVERVLLGILVVLPAALAWRFASPSFFVWDDLYHLYWSNNIGGVWSYAFGETFWHLAPGHRLTYLAVDRLAPMSFEAALAILVTFHAISTVLLQRILTLLFGRAWWTYALALAWAVSVAYLPAFAWFAAGAHSFPAITATLASIHGYLCWRATGRRGWLVWSLVAMILGLAFYVKALLVPLYLVLMRVLLLDPGARLRDSLRSLREEWRVWAAYAAVCGVYLIAFSLGPYPGVKTGATVGDVLSYLRVFWVEGVSPTVFGLRVSPYGQDDWHRIVIVAAQVALFSLVAWSLARRPAAWRAWAFLAVAVVANALMVVGRVSQFGPDAVGHEVRYYTEPALIVALAVAFAFAAPRLRARVAAVEPVTPSAVAAPSPAGTGFRLPTARVGIAALVALAAYVGVTLVTSDTLAKPWSAEPSTSRVVSGRVTRPYFDNLRSDLAAARRAGAQPSLLDHDFPRWVIAPLFNQQSRPEGVRFNSLSSLVPLVDERVTFNQPGRLYIVRPDGHLERTRFVPAAGGSPAELTKGRVRIRDARVERRDGEWCVAAEGPGAALEWVSRPHLRGRDWWLRVRYRTDPAEPVGLESNAGIGWGEEDAGLPPMDDTGTAIAVIGELPTGVPINAGVRLLVPPSGRVCLRSLEIGSFDPPAPPQTAGQASE